MVLPIYRAFTLAFHSSYRGTWVPTCLCRENYLLSPLPTKEKACSWLTLLSGSFSEGRSSSLSVQSLRHCLGHVFPHVEGYSVSSLATYSVFPLVLPGPRLFTISYPSARCSPRETWRYSRTLWQGGWNSLATCCWLVTWPTRQK